MKILYAFKKRKSFQRYVIFGLEMFGPIGKKNRNCYLELANCSFEQQIFARFVAGSVLNICVINSRLTHVKKHVESIRAIVSFGARTQTTRNFEGIQGFPFKINITSQLGLCL